MKFTRKIKSIGTNNKIILTNTAAAFIIKGFALIISFLTTPAFIHYFNDNAVLGIWYTLLSVLLWFLNFDLGIGNGIRNNLVKDFANHDAVAAKKTISSGMFSSGLVTLALTGIGIIIISSVDLKEFFNINKLSISYKALYWSAILVFVTVMLRFFLTTISSIFYALQKSSVNNFLALCVSLLQLGFVSMARYDSPEKRLIALSVAYLLLSNLPVIIAGVVVFCTRLRKCTPSVRYINKQSVEKIMGIGIVFFICQILYMLIINTNEFLITNQFGPEYTTDYSFYYKLTSLISMLVTLALTPIWSVITKAMAEKNYVWLNKLYKKLKLIGLGTILLQFAFIPFLQFAMNIWLGKNSITVNYITAIAFACFGGAFVYSSILSTIVCGMARMKLQAICYFLGIIIKFALVFSLSATVKDWTIVVWSNAIILIPYCILQQIDLNRYLNRKIKQQKIDEV